MEVGKWNPDKGRPVLCGVPLALPSEDSVNRCYMLFYTMIGGYATIVQTMITDLYNYIKEERKDLYRFNAKKKLVETKKCADDLIAGFKLYMKRQGLYQIWLDTTDILEDEITSDVQKQFYAIDNQFMKHKVGEHKLYTLIMIAEVSAGMLETSIQKFTQVMREQNGMHVFNLAAEFRLPIKGVHARAREVMELLYPKSIDNEVFSECPDKFNLGFEVIALKVLDYERADKALGQAVRMSGLNLTFDGSKPDHVEDNSGTPWNDAQERALIMSFANTPDKEVALIVGRSVYEVRKKAKELGLKKSEKYLNEIRMKNLKKKQNEKDT